MTLTGNCSKPLPVRRPSTFISGGAALSRSIVRRIQSRQHVDDWLADVCIALNQICGLGDVCAAGEEISHDGTLEGDLASLRSHYVAAGKPPQGSTPQGALRALLGSDAGHGTDCVGGISVFREGAVALPPCDLDPIHLCNALDSDAKEILGNSDGRLLVWLLTRKAALNSVGWMMCTLTPA